MMLPGYPILDQFLIPSGPPPNSNWVDFGLGMDGLIATGAGCTLEPGGADGIAFWGGMTTADCGVYLTVSQFSAAFIAGNAILYLRYDPVTGAGYRLLLQKDVPGNSIVQLQTADGAVVITTILGLTFQDGDAFLVDASGNMLSIYQKPVGGIWTLIGSVANNLYLYGGFIGVELIGGVGDFPIITDFGGGHFVPIQQPCITFPPVTLPSHYRSTGLTIIAEDPILKTTRGWSERLTHQVQSYNHEIRAIAGYWQSEILINHSQDAIEDWIQNGLGRHIIVKDEAGIQIFEGFVNTLTAKLGPLDLVLGPLLDVGNQNAYVFSTIDNTVSPPVLGVRDKTAYVDDLDSQGAYGIIQKVQSTSGSTAALAAQFANTFTTERAWPPTSRQSSLLGGSPGNLQIGIFGYWHWLTAYVYNQTAATGEIGVSTKLQAVLAAQPNAALFSTDYTRIAPNAVLVPQYENDDRTAEDVIKGLNSVGSASYERMNCGFYNKRQFVYEVAAQEIRYVQRITENGAVMDMVGNRIDPWRVLPQGYVFYADFLAGRLPPVTSAQLKRDPRCGFVETVKYTAPYGLSVNGIKVNTLDQMLCRAGLAGQGA